MKRFTNILLQIVGTATSAYTVFGGFVPPKYQGQLVTGVSLAQGIAALVAHHYNPDGTNAKTAYVPPAPGPSPMYKGE